MFKRSFSLLIVFLAIIFAVFPLLTPGFIPTHDGEYHLIRFYEFEKNLRAGNFFPRWAPGLNNGYGVPLFSFFYPLPNYFGGSFHLLGFSLVDSFKLTMAVGLILGGLFFYLWTKSLFSNWPALVGAAFYILAPYFLVDVYIRGSVGEVLALAFMPAVLWLVEKKSVFAGFFLALVILSHNVLALIFFPFLIGYLIFRKISALYFLTTVGLSFGLSCYFWLPALVEAKYVTGLKMINFADHFPALFQLIIPSWGTGFSVLGINDGMSFQIGIPHLLVVILAFFFGRKNRLVLFFLFCLTIVLFLLLEISLPIWKTIPFMSSFQYPWRFLGLMVLLSSFLAAWLVSLKKSKTLSAFLVFLALFFYGRYGRPIIYPPRSDDFYLSNPIWSDGTATLGNSFSTIWLPVGKLKRAENRLIVIEGKSEIENLFSGPTEYKFRIKNLTPTKFQANIAYFPGWKVEIDGKEKSIEFNNGLIEFLAEDGEHLAEIEFTDTPIRSLASKISLISLLFWGGAVILKKRR